MQVDPFWPTKAQDWAGLIGVLLGWLAVVLGAVWLVLKTRVTTDIMEEIEEKISEAFAGRDDAVKVREEDMNRRFAAVHNDIDVVNRRNESQNNKIEAGVKEFIRLHDDDRASRDERERTNERWRGEITARLQALNSLPSSLDRITALLTELLLEFRTKR